MWTIRTIIRYFDTCTGKSIELVVEQYVAIALQELFGTVFVGAVTVTYPLLLGQMHYHSPCQHFCHHALPRQA